MLRKLLVTDDSKATAILRLVLGIVFFAHGAQKLLGWFGGPGLSGSMGLFTGYLHIPAPFAFLAIAAEFFGGLGLIVGFLCRFSAASLILIMAGAIALVHGQNGFFLGHGPSDTLATSGFEYNLALIELLIPILIAGPGSLAIGRMLPLPKSAGTGRPIIILE